MAYWEYPHRGPRSLAESAAFKAVVQSYFHTMEKLMQSVLENKATRTNEAATRKASDQAAQPFAYWG